MVLRVKNLDGMLHLLMERLNDQKLQKRSESDYIGDCISFDRRKFDDMDERVAMSDPDTYNLVYLNKALRHDLGLTEDEDITGKKCYEVLEGAKSPCEFCTNERLSRDYFISGSTTTQEPARTTSCATPSYRGAARTTALPSRPA